MQLMLRTLIISVLLIPILLLGQENVMPIQLTGDVNGEFDHDLLPPKFHSERREALRAKLPIGGVAVLFANPVRNRSNDIDYEYHQDPNFYYLTGLREPNAVLFVFKEPRNVNGDQVTELIVVQKRDPSKELWTGRRTGSEGAVDGLGLQTAITGEDYISWDARWSKEDSLFVQFTNENLVNNPHDQADLSDLHRHFDRTKGSARAGEAKVLDQWLADLRAVKLPEELALMRKAIDITCLAQNDLMRKLRPEMTEYQTEAIVEYVFKINGAEAEGFPSIQGGGPHSCVLHYLTNRRTLGANDLLVSDIGAEYHGYTADVTRTLPANGVFSPEQRLIYELVYEAQEAGIAQVRAGKAFHAAHHAATEVISKGLIELGIIKNEAEVRRYFMHGTSHYLGLDVHDAGLYGPLVTGNVITVEPGIYIAKDSPCDPKWWDIGVRIEDDILVTDGAPEILSVDSPRKWEEVEAMMKMR